jgi:hypothetical protein
MALKFQVSTPKSGRKLLINTTNAATNQRLPNDCLMLQHLPTSKRLNYRLLTFLLLFSGSLAAQQNFLEVPVKLEIEKGDMKEVVIKVKKDGKDAFTQNGSSKLRFKLDFNKQYTLIFTKPGYITKTIQINTKAPSARISNGFDPYKIGVKLFLQNAENMVIYNQPVANIKYDQNLDEFNFDTDYSKSILSAISRDTEEETAAATQNSTQPAETQNGNETSTPTGGTGSGNESPVSPTPAPEPIATEPPPTPAPAPTPVAETPPTLTASTNTEPTPEAITTPPGMGDQEQKVTATGSEGESNKSTPKVASGEEQSRTANGNGDRDEKRRGRSNSGDDGLNKKLKVTTGEDPFKVTSSTSTGNDAPAGFTPGNESEKITREDIVERNRVVTKIKVIKNGIQTEYSRVYYNWGGLYYFKNNTMSISENLFVNWTGVRN